MAKVQERHGRAVGSSGPAVRVVIAPTYRPWWRNDWTLCLGLVALTLALYGQVIGHPFIDYDDNAYVTENSHVQSGLTWQTLVWSFNSTEDANWHPLTWLSHALDCQIFGLNAGGHHLTNLLLHAINVALLFFLLRRSTGEPVLSFVAAAIFAIHPFNVESVAWVAERKNVLSTMFFLLTLAAYGWYAQAPNWKRYLLVASLFACSLASKPMMVTLPAVLLLLDYWPLQRIKNWGPASVSFPVPQAPASRLILEKLPLLLLSAGSAAVTLTVQSAGGAVQSVQAFPLGVRLETALSGYALYLLKTFWPASFGIYYPDPFDPFLNQVPTAADHLLVTLGALLLIVVSMAAWRHHERRPYFLFGWLWYLGTLIPVIGFVKAGAQVIADRYAYVPLTGVFISVVWGLSDLGHSQNNIMIARWRFAATAVALAVLFSLAFAQVRHWRSTMDLFSHTLAVTRNNYIANDKIAVLLFRQRNPESLRYYAAAAEIAPLDPMSHEAVAGMLDEEGRYQDAIRAYDVVLRGSTDAETLGLAHSNLGAIYARLGDYDQARTHAQEAKRLAPARVDAEIQGLIGVYAQNPTPQGYVKLSLLLDQQGRLEEARAACRKAAALAPSSPEVLRVIDHLNRE
jgi:tetratricopeptide (TPR) repeat protein